jgi:formylglycine-generating enzyme required for sulfatase activity
MVDASTPEQIKLKVFVSYSRKDEELAQELLAGLQAAGFEPYLDKRDIAAGEEWEARLGRLIEAADTVVFVISPDAIASERCAWEVERTVTLKKRLLPVVWRGVEEAEVPPRLKQLNYIFFDRPHLFGPSLLALATALKTDIIWVREHTRISEAALRWEARGRADAMLIRGVELAAAKDWLKAQPKYAPEPTLLQHEFITAGEDAESARMNAERQRLDQITAAQDEREKALEREKAALRRGQRALAGVGALIVLLALGGVGWWKQDFLREQYYWHTVMGPSVLSVKREKETAAKPGLDFKECATRCPTMVVVPAGKFTMGSPESEKYRSDGEGPQHEVTIAKPFAVGRTELTFAEWDACVAAGACKKAVDNGWGRGNRPVINVSWEEAKAYVDWLSRMTGKDYRLLSEAEWEYAARSGKMAAYFWGNDIGEGNANCRDCGSQWGGKQTAPVGSFKPNRFGLYDMNGNVWEWVEDMWHGDYEGAPTDGSPWFVGGDPGQRVVRGGSWINNSRLLRVACRYGGTGGFRDNFIGFRLARTLNP